MSGTSTEPSPAPTTPKAARPRLKVEVDAAELAKTVAHLRARATSLRASARWYLISTVSVVMVGLLALGLSGVLFLASTKIDDRVIDSRMREFDQSARDGAMRRRSTV